MSTLEANDLERCGQGLKTYKAITGDGVSTVKVADCAPCASCGTYAVVQMYGTNANAGDLAVHTCSTQCENRIIRAARASGNAVRKVCEDEHAKEKKATERALRASEARERELRAENEKLTEKVRQLDDLRRLNVLETYRNMDRMSLNNRIINEIRVLMDCEDPVDVGSEGLRATIEDIGLMVQALVGKDTNAESHLFDFIEFLGSYMTEYVQERE